MVGDLTITFINGEKRKFKGCTAWNFELMGALWLKPADGDETTHVYYPWHSIKKVEVKISGSVPG
jgi:hypothetical protein